MGRAVALDESAPNRVILRSDYNLPLGSKDQMQVKWRADMLAMLSPIRIYSWWFIIRLAVVIVFVISFMYIRSLRSIPIKQYYDSPVFCWA